MPGSGDRGVYTTATEDENANTGALQPSSNYMDDGERESPVFRDSSERPIIKLSVRLIDTYKNINKVSKLRQVPEGYSTAFARHRIILFHITA
jgi:hypothetical protein